MDRTTHSTVFSADELRRKKTSFSLDLGPAKSAATTPSSGARPSRHDGPLLGSPDVNLLALATPDLERFIVQQAYGVSSATAKTPPAAPTPSVATTPTQLLFPRSVTEEQEAYARGFLDALFELQRQQRQQVNTTPFIPTISDSRPSFVGVCGDAGEYRLENSQTDTLPVSNASTTEVHSIVADVAGNKAFVAGAHLFPGFSDLRSSSFNFSPLSRHSAMVQSHDVKVTSFIDTSETLDLSPLGRLANRTIDQATTTTNVCAADETQPTDTVHLVVEPTNVACSTESVHPTHLCFPADAVLNSSSVQTAKLLGLSFDNSNDSDRSESLPTIPIDMSVQEQAKLDRKREKNRFAAQKCRMLKLERIDRLQHRVNELKSQNAQLSDTAAELYEQVKRLRQMVVEHVEGGCQVMMIHSVSCA